MVVGTGRSGTHHFSAVSQGLGLEVGHEELKVDGISSWCLVSDQPVSPYGPAMEDLPVEEYVIGHQLRNPIKTIPSLMTINKRSWKFIKEDAKPRTAQWWWRKAPLKVKAMWHWLDWNQRAEQMADLHWTLGQADQIGSALADALDLPELEQNWGEAWHANDKASNSAKDRIPSLRNFFKTSPSVAYRRFQHAMHWLPATEEALYEADPVLAKDIMDFWAEFKDRTTEIHSS